MNPNKKNSAKEPADAYEVIPRVDANEEVFHPILVQLIEKSKKEFKEGKFITHEDVMKNLKEKFPFLK